MFRARYPCASGLRETRLRGNVALVSFPAVNL